MSESKDISYDKVVVLTGDNTFLGDLIISGELIYLKGKLEKVEEYLEKNLGKNYEILKDKKFEGNVSCSKDVYYLEFTDIPEDCCLIVNGAMSSYNTRNIYLDFDN